MATHQTRCIHINNTNGAACNRVWAQQRTYLSQPVHTHSISSHSQAITLVYLFKDQSVKFLTTAGGKVHFQVIYLGEDSRKWKAGGNKYNQNAITWPTNGAWEGTEINTDIRVFQLTARQINNTRYRHLWLSSSPRAAPHQVSRSQVEFKKRPDLCIVSSVPSVRCDFIASRRTY